MHQQGIHREPATAKASGTQDRVLFLVGARRSGTNWLERALTTHPDVVAMPSETYLFSQGIQPLSELFQSAAPNSPMMAKTFMERAELNAALREFMDRVFLSSLEQLGPESKYLLERTPWHAMHLELIAGVYPDARILHLVRDGRAVARSLRALPRGPATIGEAAAEWRDCVACRDHGRDLFGERYIEVRYEDLLLDPSAGVSRIFGWLGLDSPADLMARVEGEAAVEFNVDPGSPGVNADKWRTELTHSDLEEIESVAGPRLIELGYGRVVAETVGAATEPALRRTRWREQYARGLRGRTGSLQAARRKLARERKRELMTNLSAVERFGDHLALGRYDQAFELCTTNAAFLLKQQGPTIEGRGENVFREIAKELEEHRQTGLKRTSSGFHSSPRWFTVVLEYELADRRSWAVTSIYEMIEGKIVRMTLYRFELRRT